MAGARSARWHRSAVFFMIELRIISQLFAGPRGWTEALHDIKLSMARLAQGNVAIGGRDLTDEVRRAVARRAPRNRRDLPAIQSAVVAHGVG
jgi:hypothetical protein